MPWVAGGIFLNPGAGAVLVDTGSLLSAVYEVGVLVTYNPTGFECQFQVTAADGVTVLQSKILPITLAFQPLLSIRRFLALRAGEHLRVINRAVATGAEVEASIFYSVVEPNQT